MAIISFVIANNVNTSLATALTSGATTMTLASSANLPTLSAGQVMPLTLNDAATGQIYEVVYVTAISGVTLTVQRAKEGTGAQNWNIGDFVYCAPTQGSVAVKNGDPAQQFMVAAATATNQAVTKGQTDSTYAPVAGNASQTFAVANATATNQAVSLGQANATYAALHGSASNTFAVANATASNQAVAKGQADAAYAPIAGNASQTFDVATAAQPTDAVPLAQMQDGQTGYSGIMSPATGATLDITFLGIFIFVGGGNTYTLDALSTFANGEGLVCCNSSAVQAVTFLPTGSDIINLGSATNVNPFILQPGDTVKFVKSAANRWSVESVSIHAVLPLVIAAATGPTHAVQLSQMALALGGFSGAVSLTNGQTVTSAFCGELLHVTGGNTYNLDAIANFTGTESLNFINNTNSLNATIVQNGTDIVVVGSTQVSSIAVPGGQLLRLTKISSTSWRADGMPTAAILPFPVAAATADSHAINQGQADAAYAPIAGNASQTFAVANASASNQAVALGQANAAYAAIAGSTSHTFQVAAATAATQAPQFQQVNPGRLLNVQTFTASGTYTPSSSSVSKVIVCVQAAGAGGNGAPATGTLQSSMGAGGSGGSYYSALLTQGFTGGVAVTVGAAGSGGGVGSAGGAGGASSFGTIISCPGGVLAGTIPAQGALVPFNGALGPAAATVSLPSSSVTLENIPGQGANFCIFGGGALAAGGGGGGSRFGVGGNNIQGVSAGQPAKGFGGGGGGACVNTASTTGQPGATGTQGVVVVYEYS